MKEVFNPCRFSMDDDQDFTMMSKNINNARQLDVAQSPKSLNGTMLEFGDQVYAKPLTANPMKKRNRIIEGMASVGTNERCKTRDGPRIKRNLMINTSKSIASKGQRTMSTTGGSLYQ